MTCVTNDKNLRRKCEENKVPRLWGLELIAELKTKEGISKEDALKVAEIIRSNNPKFISEKVINQFREKVENRLTCS